MLPASTAYTKSLIEFVSSVNSFKTTTEPFSRIEIDKFSKSDGSEELKSIHNCHCPHSLEVKIFTDVLQVKACISSQIPFKSTSFKQFPSQS